MRLEAPFFARGDHIGVELPGAHAVFTTRRGGVSGGPYASLNLGRWTEDEPAAVEENRDRLAASLGLERSCVAQGRQVHGSTVRRVEVPPDPELAPADGQATGLPSVPVLVLTADCLPIALATPEAVAMVHAGWRGLAGGVVAEGVAALREVGGSGPIVAAIGPGAGPCCYEAGDEVHAAFSAHGAEARRGRHADLKLVARRALEAAGAAEVHDVRLCTMCAPPGLFFSHRRDGGLTGRQAGLAWRA